MRLSRQHLSKSLMKEQRETNTYMKLQSHCHLHSLLFCAQFMYELHSARDKSPLFIFISFPSTLSFSTISSNWIHCGDVLLLFFLFHPNHSAFSFPFLHPQPPWPSADKTSISVLCLFNISPLVGGCIIYRAWDTCSDSLQERYCTI